jgi:hypothetical protein
MLADEKAAVAGLNCETWKARTDRTRQAWVLYRLARATRAKMAEDIVRVGSGDRE